MSLQVASRIAVSSLMTTQVQLNVASANIANADTEGYSRKTVSQTALGLGGTKVSAISSTADRVLLRSLAAANTALGAATTTQGYADRLQTLLGTTTSSTGTSLANRLASVQTALTSLGTTPESDTVKAQLASDLDTVASQLRTTSAGIQAIRADADGEIASAVDTVNTNLATIASLNQAIAAAKSRGDATGDLEDQRDTAAQAIASQIGITTSVSAGGTMRVATTSGGVLLDDQVHTLSYTAAGTVTAATAYTPGADSSGFVGITLDGKDVTAALTTGSLGALIAQRDTALPNAQAELDQLAQGLATALNAVHNAGTALPPPSSLTGTAALDGGSALDGSGTVRFAVTDEAGKLVSYQDLDLASISTVDDLVSAINGIPGLSASLDDEGHLTVAATDADTGFAVGGEGTAGDDAEGLSAYLGLNDLMTGTDASTIAVRADILKSPSLMATASLDTSDDPATGSAAIASSSTIADDLVSALSDRQSFAAAGALGAASSTLADRASSIVSVIAIAAAKSTTDLDTQTAAQSAASDAVSSKSGVNLDEETARLTELQNAYSTASQVLSVVAKMFDALLSAVQS